MDAPFNKEVSSRVSAEVAETVQRDFYRAMSSKTQRSYLSTHFVADNDMGAGHRIPDIIFQGTKYYSPGNFQEFVEALPKLSYEVQSLSAVVINPALVMEGFTEQDRKKGKAAVISVVVGGRVKIGEHGDDERIFSDNFVMMPNPEASKQGRRDRGKREWLIGVYNSRFVG